MDISRELSNQQVDSEVYADPARINALFEHLGKAMPFAKAHPDGYEPFLVATKHADVLDIEKRADAFHNGDNPTFMTPQAVLTR